MLNSKQILAFKTKFLLSLIVFLGCNTNNLITESERKYLEANKDITVGLFINYPPFEFINENGKIDGVMIDYFTLLEDNINHKFKKKFYDDWQQLINDLKNKEIDVVLEIQKTKNRSQYLTFTKPILIGNHAIITKKGVSYTSLSQLDGKDVAVCKNHAIEEYLKKNHPNINLIGKSNESAAINALSKNNVEAFVGLESLSNYVITTEGYKDIVVGKIIKYQNKLGIAVINSKPILAEIIKKGNKSISFEEKDTILKKWFFSLNKPIQYKISFWKIVILIISLILISFFLTTSILKKKVKKRTRLLNSAKTEAEKSNKLKSLFLQNISDELKKPLKSIRAFLKNQKNESYADLPSKKQFNQLSVEAHNLTTLLNNIVNISDLYTNHSKNHDGVVNINYEIDTIAKVYRNRANEKGLTFEYENQLKHKQNLFVIIDDLKFKSLMKGLLDNALKVSHTGSIILKTTCNDKELEVIVKNAQKNSNASEIKKIFNSIITLNKNGFKHYNSKNIELSIASKTIKMLNGTMSVDKTGTRGLQFTANIPVTFTQKVTKSKIPRQKNLRILITEDMKLNYLVLKKTLEKVMDNTINILWAKNGKEAVDLVEENNFDLIFMDIKMPILNGFDATKIIKKSHREIKIIAQTAYTQEDDIYKAKSIGFDGYITKPIDSNILKATLKKLNFLS